MSFPGAITTENLLNGRDFITRREVYQKLDDCCDTPEQLKEFYGKKVIKLDERASAGLLLLITAAVITVVAMPLLALIGGGVAAFNSVGLAVWGVSALGLTLPPFLMWRINQYKKEKRLNEQRNIREVNITLSRVQKKIEARKNANDESAKWHKGERKKDEALLAKFPPR